MAVYVDVVRQRASLVPFADLRTASRLEALLGADSWTIVYTIDGHALVTAQDTAFTVAAGFQYGGGEAVFGHGLVVAMSGNVPIPLRSTAGVPITYFVCP